MSEGAGLPVSGWQVILGGGRTYMMPRGTPDPEYPQDPKQNGARKDGVHLIQTWLSTRKVPPAASAENGGEGGLPGRVRLALQEGGSAQLGLCAHGTPVHVNTRGTRHVCDTHDAMLLDPLVCVLYVNVGLTRVAP